MLKGITHNAITARDMDASIRFYTEALGFTKAFENVDPQTGLAQTVYLHIERMQFLEIFRGATEPNPWRSGCAGFHHMCLEVEDICDAVRRVKEAGYAIDVEPKRGHDLSMQAWLNDPDGLRIELMQIDPRSPQAKYR